MAETAARWLPIALADKTITDVQEFEEVGITIKTSDRYWVRDDDGRVYEAAWSEGRYGRDYWWDFEGESPVDPVEFMPHPLDPRWIRRAPEWACAARKQGSAGGNDPADCDWPICGCDPHANKVIAALPAIDVPTAAKGCADE